MFTNIMREEIVWREREREKELCIFKLHITGVFCKNFRKITFSTSNIIYTKCWKNHLVRIINYLRKII